MKIGKQLSLDNNRRIIITIYKDPWATRIYGRRQLHDQILFLSSHQILFLSIYPCSLDQLLSYLIMYIFTINIFNFVVRPVAHCTHINKCSTLHPYGICPLCLEKVQKMQPVYFSADENEQHQREWFPFSRYARHDVFFRKRVLSSFFILNLTVCCQFVVQYVGLSLL